MNGELVAVISAFITGVLSLIGVIITNNNSNRKVENQIQLSQAITDTKLENITEEVKEIKINIKENNEFATKIPIMENRIDTLENTVKEIKDEITK